MANRTPRLGLHEEVMLLALNDEKGTVGGGTWYGFALGGAVLSELLLQERIEVEEDGKKSFLKVVVKKKTGDNVLDEALEKVINAKRRATLETWVTRFSALKDLRHRVALLLCDKKILRADKKQVLLFFSKRVYPERDHGPEKEIIARVKNAVFSSGRDADPRTVVLVSLCHSSGLLNAMFDKKRLKTRKTHLESFVKGSTLGGATQKAIQAAQAAILVATMVPIITATTVTH